METPLAILFVNARRRLGISQAELAKRADIAPSMVSEIERGACALHKSKAPQVAAALHVSEQAVLDAIKGTHIIKKGGGPAISPYAFVVEFTPLEHRRIVGLARSLGLTPEQIPNWLRQKVLDWLASLRP